MLVMRILTLLFNVLDSMLSSVHIPTIDASVFDDVLSFFDQIFDFAGGLISVFIPWGIVEYGIPVLIAVIFAVDIYKFVMWILRKLPFLNIS